MHSQSLQQRLGWAGLAGKEGRKGAKEARGRKAALAAHASPATHPAARAPPRSVPARCQQPLRSAPRGAAGSRSVPGSGAGCRGRPGAPSGGTAAAAAPGFRGCCWLPYTSLHELAEDGSDRHRLGQGSFAGCWDITPLKTGFTNGLMSRVCNTDPCAAGPLMQCCGAAMGQTEAACSTSST